MSPGGGAPRSRRGKRPGGPDTRAAILAEARACFATAGYAGTSVRGIATRVGVDPALVHHYFGTKDELFVAAVDLGLDPELVTSEVVVGGLDGAGERLIRLFLSAWNDEDTRLALLALLRGALEPPARPLVQEGFLSSLLEPLCVGLGVPDPSCRAALLSSELVGLMTVSELGVEPLASADDDRLIALYGPLLQRHLAEPLP